MGVFATASRHQPLFPPPSTISATAAGGGGGGAAGLGRFATSAGVVTGAGSSSSSTVDALARSMLSQAPPVLQPQRQQAGVGATAAAGLATKLPGGGSVSAVSSASPLPSAAATAAAATGGGIVGNGQAGEIVQEQRPWVTVGGAWRDEDNVCGYWRFSEGSGFVGGLEAGKQVRRGIGQRRRKEGVLYSYA